MVNLRLDLLVLLLLWFLGFGLRAILTLNCIQHEHFLLGYPFLLRTFHMCHCLLSERLLLARTY